MKIGIATDHHGVEIKKELIEYLKASGYEVINYGTDSTDMVRLTMVFYYVEQELA